MSTFITKRVSSDFTVWYAGVDNDTCAQQPNLVMEFLFPVHQAVRRVFRMPHLPPIRTCTAMMGMWPAIKV